MISGRSGKNFGLRTRLTLLIVSLVVVIVLVTGALTTIREKSSLEVELRRRGGAVAANLAKFTVRPLLNNDLPTLRRFVNHTMGQDYVLYAALLDLSGKVVMHSDLSKVGTFVGSAGERAPGNPPAPRYIDRRVGERGERYCDILIPILVEDIPLGSVRLGYSYMAVAREIAGARRQILLVGLLTILAGGLVAFFLALHIVSPVVEITEATRKVAEGDLEAVLTIDRGDEIGTLARSFNIMTEDLRRTTISRDFVDNIVASMLDALIVVGVDNRIGRLNRAASLLLGYSEEELLGEDIHHILPEGEDLFEGEGSRLLPSGKTLVNHETGCRARDGRLIPVLLSVSLLKDQEGAVLGAVAIAKDITERKEAEGALLESERALHDLTSRLIAAQEEERRRLSRELHDALGQALMALKLRLRAVRTDLREDQAPLREDCDRMLDNINGIADDIRRLSRDLSPSMLEDLGLSAALRRLVQDSAGPSRVESRIDVGDVDDLFPRDGQITVYRIAQEGLTNIMKHSGANLLSLTLSQQNGRVVMKLEDNGAGFDVRKTLGRAAGGEGLGLAAMHERARMLRGSLHVRSGAGAGTTITLTIPMQRKGNST